MADLQVVAVLTAKPVSEKLVGDALAALVEPTRAEAGCTSYDLFASVIDPVTFVTIETWRSQDDLDAHMQTTHVQQALAAAGDHLARAAGLAACRAHQPGGEFMTAFMLDDQRRPVVAREVLIAPGLQRRDDRVEIETRFGQEVLEPGRMLAVRPALQDARAHQGAEPRGQGVARSPGALDHLVEPAVTEKDLAHGEQRPLLPDDLQGAGDRTDPGLRRCGHHRLIIPPKSDFWTD